MMSVLEPATPSPMSVRTREEHLRESSQRPSVFLMTNSFETGGSERQFVALANSLDPTSFDVRLGCIMRKGAFNDGLGAIPAFGLGGSLYGATSMRTRWHLARHLRSNHIAIAHAFDFYTNLTLIPAAKLARVPVVIGSQRQLGDLLSRSQARAQRAAFGYCDVVICNSRAAADRLIENGLPETKIAVIGNGLPSEAFVEASAAIPRVSARLRVGMVARMNARSKNHHLFLRAAAKLQHRFSEVDFVFVGDGPLRPEIETEASRLGLLNRLMFLGDRRDMPAVLASLDVSVLPSSSESLSNVILESMAAGVPVVASAIGGNVELLNRDRGVLVNSMEDEEWANAIHALLRDENRRRAMGRSAKEFAQANFTIEQMRQHHQQLYRELLERKHWRPRVAGSGGVSTKRSVEVAIVAASLRYIGGQSAQADLLIKHWRNDLSCHAQLVPIDPRLPRIFSWAERIPGLRTIVRQPFYVWALWRAFKHADIAHVFSASYWSFLVAPFPAYIVARLRRKKILIHYHSGEARDHLQRFHSARHVLARVDRLVVPSQYLVDVFREFDVPAVVVPNVADFSQFRFRARARLRPHLVCTRGFHPYYGIDVVVRAFAEVKKAFPEACLDLVGGGSCEPQIRSLVHELRLTGVNFAGVASRHEISRFYDQADIFINASNLDNVPVSVLEAFASGTPVVSTSPECMPYLIEHERTGLLSPVGDAAALAQNVVRVLQDPDLAGRLALNAYETSKRYSWEHVREEWLEVYRSVLQGTPGQT